MSIYEKSALDNQHIVISGGLGALGLAIVKGLVDHGANVTINDIVPQDTGHERLQSAEIPLDHCMYIPGDITQESVVENFVTSATERFGSIHTALCHTGMVQAKSLVDVSITEWESIINLNVTSAFLLGKHTARSMITSQVSGHLIFTISWVSDVPWPDIGPYNASKAAMKQLMRSYARELADKNIRANAIAPGIVAAGMAKRQWDTEPDYQARAKRAIPLGYMQPIESVVNGFIFLCSRAANYMTGSVLLMDGGCSLYPMDDS